METNVRSWFVVAGIMGASLVAGILLRFILDWSARRKTGDAFLATLVRALKTHALLWCLVIGAVVSLRLFPLAPRWEKFADNLSAAVVILLATAVVAHVTARLVPRLGERFQLPISAASFSTTVVQIIVCTMGALLLLSNFGIAIGPLLTALGVGSLAVGLALQDTLSNLFAGFYLIASRQIRIGDFIELERGIGYATRKGYLLDIGWRASRMKTLTGQILLVPNSFITQSYIVSYQEYADLVLPVEIQVNIKDDLSAVERTLMSVGQDTLRQFSITNSDRRVAVRFLTGREPFSATVLLKVPIGTEQQLLTHEFVKNVRDAFAREQVAV